MSAMATLLRGGLHDRHDAPMTPRSGKVVLRGQITHEHACGLVVPATSSAVVTEPMRPFFLHAVLAGARGPPQVPLRRRQLGLRTVWPPDRGQGKYAVETGVQTLTTMGSTNRKVERVTDSVLRSLRSRSPKDMSSLCGSVWQANTQEPQALVSTHYVDGPIRCPMPADTT